MKNSNNFRGSDNLKTKVISSNSYIKRIHTRFCMSSVAISLIILNFCITTAHAQWTGVGYYHNNYPRISDGTIENISLAIDNDGTPIVAYRDNNIYGGTLAVKKFNGIGWTGIGYYHNNYPRISDGTVENISLAIDNDGTPIVAYRDNNINGGTLAVKKFNGIGWTGVGYYSNNQPRISDGTIENISLAIDNDGTPIVAYRDNNINGGTLAVKKFNGIGWTGVGYYSNNQPRISDGTVENISLTIDNDGTPIVAYRDNNINGGALAVKKFNGIGWTGVGYYSNNQPRISDGTVENISLTIDNDGTPIVAYRDNNINGGTLAVKKFNGIGWTGVGYYSNNQPRISDGTIENISLAIGNDGTPIVAYRDNNINGGTLAVKKFDGIGWTGVGYYSNNQPRISDGTVENISLAIGNDGTPIVAYRDNNIYGGTLAVKKFNYNYLNLRWRLQAMFPVPDTLSVKLRNSVYPYVVVDSAKVLAELSSTNYRKTIRFKNIITGNSYYIVAKHRNSIETWSAYPVEFLPDTTFYNFTTSISKAYGNNMVMTDGLASFFSGDINQDGTIDAGDLGQVENALGNEGYIREDLNGDGIVDANDLSTVENNASSSISVIKP